MSKPKGTKQKVKLKGLVAVKQRTVIHRYLKNIGKDGKGASMAEAGKGIYSESYLNSGNIKKTKVWKELTDNYLPDDLLVEMNQKLITKKETIVKQNTKGDIEVLHTGEIDVQSVKAGLELAYRIKGKNDDTLKVEENPLKNLSDAELAAMIKKQKDKFKKRD